MTRELDAEVARIVMGTDVGDIYYDGTWQEIMPHVPSYSADIADAWKVVEKMRERGFTFWMDDLGYTEQGCWRCEFDTQEPQKFGWGWVECSTPYEVICRAALETVRADK